MKREQSFEERANLLRSDDRRYKSLGSVHQNKCKVYKRRWYILIVFSICASLNNLIWNTWGPIQGTSQVVFGWDNTTITLMADWGPISFVVAVVPMCWLMDMKGKQIVYSFIFMFRGRSTSNYSSVMAIAKFVRSRQNPHRRETAVAMWPIFCHQPIWDPFLVSPETFRAHFGLHNSLQSEGVSRHETLH